MSSFFKPQTDRTSPVLLRAEEVAKILNVSISLVYKLIEAGSLPSVQINSSVRIIQSDLYQYINNSWTGWKD